MNDINHEDLTAQAAKIGWFLPEGWRVATTLSRDDDVANPGDAGDAFLIDHPADSAHARTHGFCEWCEEWVHVLDAESAVTASGRIGADHRAPQAGDLASAGGSVECVAVGTRRHKLDEPLAVRWWREDRWTFVNVDVWVADSDGREWGRSSLGGCVSGQFPVVIDTVEGRVESRYTTPYADADAIDPLIREACAQAKASVEAFVRAQPRLCLHR